MKKLLISIGLIALIVFFSYSLVEYKRSGITEQGIVTCSNGQCFWSAHIHVDAPIQICGEKYSMPKFKGPLNSQHTHGDDNLIHWHDKRAFDAEKKQFLDPTPFTLELIFKTLDLPITDESLLSKKDGDMCGDSPAGWKIFVNGRSYLNWRSYEWKDRDIVHFIFDARSVQEVEEELGRNPMKFPNIGEG